MFKFTISIILYIPFDLKLSELTLRTKNDYYLFFFNNYCCFCTYN